MKKYIYMILSAAVLALGFTSCVEEDGPGVPQLKKMHLQADDYTVDMTQLESTDFVLRWIDVTNAKYVVTFTNGDNDIEHVLGYSQVPGELSTMSTTFPCQEFVDYADYAGLEKNTETYDVKEGDKTNTYVREYYSYYINVTGTPVDTSIPSGLAPEGSTATARVTVIVSDTRNN